MESWDIDFQEKEGAGTYLGGVRERAAALVLGALKSRGLGGRAGLRATALPSPNHVKP